MRTVARGSPVDERWSVAGMVLSQVRHGNVAEGSPLTLDDVMASADYRNLMTAKVEVGDRAPDFELAGIDGAGSVRLGALLAERPVALIFGSYTWPPFRAQVGTLEQLAARYGERVAFLVVYIREAHPEEGWILPENRRSGVAVHEPATDSERRAVASACAANLELSIPTVVDGLDNEVASAYGGWPDRLYLIGRDGRIAYQGGEGPFGFKPKELELAIEQESASTAP
jgi:Iodothyronine deiodinase